jgi:hypothetical protein
VPGKPLPQATGNQKYPGRAAQALGSGNQRPRATVMRATSAATSATTSPLGCSIVTARRNSGMVPIATGSINTGRTWPDGLFHFCSANLSSVSV